MVARRSQRGFALLLGIAAVTLIGAGVLLVSRCLDADLTDYRLEERAVALGALSDAAMAETLARLAADSSFTGVAERPFGAGRLGSQVQTSSTGTVVIIAWGSRGSGRAEISAEISMATGGPRVVQWRRRISGSG